MEQTFKKQTKNELNTDSLIHTSFTCIIEETLAHSYKPLTT